MLNLSCANMKIGSAEANGPILPVWQALEGCNNDMVPESSTREEGPSGENMSPEKLARVASCPTNSRLKKDVFMEKQNAYAKSFSEIECRRKHDNHFDTPPLQNLPRRLSSSTAISLSQQNLALQSNSFYTNGTSILSSSSPREASKEDIEDEEDSDNQLAFKYRHTRINSKKMRQRIVQKAGECNVTHSNVAKRRRRFLSDIFTTLVDIQWRWTLLVFATSFLLSWLTFAIIWYVISLFHKDFLPEHLPANQEAEKWTPCVINIVSFTSCFLFSVETQHTIGYGSRYATEECPEAILVLCLQSITGVMIQAFMVGVVFAKLSRPKKRTQTLMFSRNACICQRDGQLCLLFRVGDMRKSHIIEAHIRAQLIRTRVTDEGEILPFFQYDLNVGYDVGEDRIFFVWPMTIVHKIDESSPLYDISAHDLLREKFEIVVMLEGVIESTGMTTQARSSYLPNEVYWGYRFESLLFFKKDTGEYTVDYSLFNNVRQVKTPLCSARHVHECRSRETSSVSPITPLTPMTPLTPITPGMPSFEQISRNSVLGNTSYNLVSNENISEYRDKSSSSPTHSSSSTLKDCPSCATSEDDLISQKYSPLSEVIISQPLLSATNQL